MSFIRNAANVPLNKINGTVPDVSGAMQDRFQPMVFAKLIKTVQGFQLVENSAPIEFQGVIFPFTPRELKILPIGERSWSWYSVFSESGIDLKTDDVIQYEGKNFRIMSKLNFTLYGYDQYTMVTDWSGSGP